MDKDDALPIWAITIDPRDLRGLYVARKHVVTATGHRATPTHIAAADYEELISLLPPGLTRLDRSERDDPVILETWI